MILFLRPKKDFSWGVPGYAHPYENPLQLSYDCPVVFLEDVIDNFSLLWEIKHIFAFSVIPILQMGSEFWEIVRAKAIPVSGWVSTVSLLESMPCFVKAKVDQDILLRSSSVEKVLFNQFRADMVADYSSILRNSFIYKEYIVFQTPNLSFMEVLPDNVISFDGGCWSSNSKYFMGNFYSFSTEFLPELVTRSVGRPKLSAYIYFSPDFSDIKESTLDRFFEVMDEVKPSLKINLYFSGWGSDIAYFLKYGLKGVKVTVSDDFSHRVQICRSELLNSGKFPDKFPVTKTFLLRGSDVLISD